MKKLFLFITLALLSISAQSKEVSCSDVKEREIKVNSKTSIKVQTINGVCSFSVTTSSDKRVFNYSPKEYEANREWIFQSNGKVLVHNHYTTGPTDSSATSYKGYQMFPNNRELKLTTDDSDNSFNITLANGAKVYFKPDGSIDNKKTTDLKIKDTPIKIPNIPREKSSVKYEEIDHLSYSDKRKSSIRIYHRGLYSSLTSKSIGLETKSGMYIPLGIEMGKIPGNSTKASYTLFGIDDEKLCKQKMPAHYFFNYQVRCSARSPNKRCPCKYSEEQAQKLFKENAQIEKQIKSIKWSLSNLKGDERNELEQKLSILTKKYRPNLYSDIYFTCSLPRDSALSFIAGKKISGDNREVEGVSVKDTSEIIDGLISSKKCRKLEKVYSDCVECFNNEIIRVESIEKQSDLIEKVIKEL